MTPDREYEWIGFLTGFIASVDPTIDLSSEHKFAHNLRGDIFATFNNEKVVVELKRTRFGKASLNALQNQLSLYMTTGKVDDGIIFVLPDHLPSELKVDEMQIDRDGHKLNIIQITPS